MRILGAYSNPGTPRGHLQMREDRVKSYFAVLEQQLITDNVCDKAEKIWNMDETYLSLSANPTKVVARKGEKSIHAKTGSRENVTLIVCGNAAGTYLPPHLVFKGKTKSALKSWDTEHGPQNTFISVSSSGWIKQGLVLLWFTEVFLKNIGPERPQVLIFDGHDSHHHVELIHKAIENKITLIEIPSHCSHWLQPLDRTVFASLKSSWKRLVTDFTADTGCPVKHSNFFRLFNRAWTGLVSDGTSLISGFRSTGIFPLNMNAVPAEAFMPSKLYKRQGDAYNTSASKTSHPSEASLSAAAATVSGVTATISAAAATATVPSATATVYAATATVSAAATISAAAATVPAATVTVPSATVTVPAATVTVPSATVTVPSATVTVPTATSTVPTATSTVPAAAATVPADVFNLNVSEIPLVPNLDVFDDSIECFDLGISILDGQMVTTPIDIQVPESAHVPIEPRSAVQTDDGLFELPEVLLPTSKKSEGYFVITCDAAYQNKLSHCLEKQIKEKQKADRKRRAEEKKRERSSVKQKKNK